MDTRNRLDTAWELVGMLAVVAVAITVFWSIWTPKPVRRYYMSNSGTTAGMKTCVWADQEWCPDSTAFCTDDVPLAVESVKQLNSSIR